MIFELTEYTHNGGWGRRHPYIMWEQEPADDGPLHFCGGELVGGIAGYLPTTLNTPKIRDQLYEGMYRTIKKRANASRGIRLIMADVTFHSAATVCVATFAQWLKKRWPGQMTETRVCINPRTYHPTKVWVFRIP